MTEQRYDFPYECGEGWYDLIEATLDKLYLIDKNLLLMQVKEKFGLLDIYYVTEYEHDSLPAQQIYDIVNDARERSGRTCETCGLPGTLVVKNSWYKTLCETHAE